MSSGFVYILINPAFKGVKIGQTKRNPEIRAKELKTTGVPHDFIVVYEEFVTNRILVEKKVHDRFKGYRDDPSREFFQVPIKDAIRGLMEESEGYIVPRVGALKGVEILPDLKRKYPHYLKAELSSVKIVHRDEIVYLESVRSPMKHLRDEIVERSDLSFITDDDDDMFPSTRSEEENARVFVHQLCEYSLIMCTDLFTEEACAEINNRYKNTNSI